MKKPNLITVFSLLLLVTCFGCKHKESVDERIARQEREEQSKEDIKSLYRNHIEATRATLDSLEIAHRKGTISERDYQIGTEVNKRVLKEWENRYRSVD